MRGATWCCVLWGMAALAAPAYAQTPADTSAVEYFAPEGALARAGLSLYGDVRLRWDTVRDRPGGSEDLKLGRLTMRGGLMRAPRDSPLQAEIGLRLTFSRTPSPGDNPFPFPISGRDLWAPVVNEALETVDVDRAGVRIVHFSEGLVLSAGRMRSPLRLTEMVWDDDLRPVGLAAIARRSLGPIATARLGGAVYLVEEWDALFSTLLKAAQLSTLIREEGATGGDLTVSWLRFEPTARSGFVFSSPVVFDRFDVVDLQLGARAAPSGIPASIRLDLARNGTVPSDRLAARVRLAVGGAGVPAGAEVGWVFQRIEREAVPGAYNSDDWWFHSRMRGNQLWLRVGRGGFEAKVAGFHERRDDLARPTRRLTVELSARLPSR